MTPIEFTGDSGVSWHRAETFQAWVIRMNEQHLTHSHEYEAAERFWGKEKLGKIWADHQAKKAGQGEE